MLIDAIPGFSTSHMTLVHMVVLSVRFSFFFCSDKFFWVGRRSLLRWKALATHHEEARQSLMDRCQFTASHGAEEDDEVKVKGIEDNDVSMTEEEKTPQQMDENPQETGVEEDVDDSDSKFNEDLLCEHGKFTRGMSPFQAFTQDATVYEKPGKIRFYSRSTGERSERLHQVREFLNPCPKSVNSQEILS